MKIYLILMSTFLFSLSTFAETQAGWFSPECKDCPRMQTPGTTKLSDTGKRYIPGTTKKKKTPPATSTQGVSN